MPKKIALLIGVSQYGEGIPPLSSALNDVEAMQRVLQNPNLGGFEQVERLLNPDMTAMRQAIQKLFKGASKDDLVLFFFSGHGITNDQDHLYLATKNTAKDDFEATAVDASFIQGQSSNCYAKRQVLILDACYSGAIAQGWRTKSVGVDIKKQLGAEGRVVLTSSSATQTSFEQEGSTLSLYTQYLIEGIETGAADTNNDGNIYVQELHAYAKAKVQAVKPKMTPEIILDKEGFNILLANAPRNPDAEYRKLVEQYAKKGEIPSLAIKILKKKQEDLGLSDEKAKEIEGKVLEPSRRRVANLKSYKEEFAKEVERQYPLDQNTLKMLKDYQQYNLGLRDEDVVSIELEIKSVKEAEYQKQVQIEKQRKNEEYGKNLRRYEQEFSKAVQAQYPLDEYARNGLKQLQQSLGLTNEHVKKVEEIVLQQEAEKVKIPAPNNPEEGSHAQKNKKLDWAALLGKASQRISEQIIHSLGNSEDAQKNIYQEKLQRYEQELWKIVKIEFPVSHPTRIHLKDFQVCLGLNDSDIKEIEQRITAQVQEQQEENTQQNLQNKKDGTWQCILTFTGHSERVNTVAINSIGTILVSGSDDKNIKIWDIKSGDLLRTLEGHTSRINAVSLSADNQILVSGSADQKVILWNPITGSKQKTLAGHSDWVNAVVISPNRHIIASSSNDKKIQIWHPETGKILRTIKGNTDFIRALSTDVNGKVLVSSGDDKTIKVWNLNDGKVFHSLTGHSSLVRTLALSQDGNIVVSGSDDQTIKIWNLNNGQLLNTLIGHSKSVRSVAISSDGNTVVSGSDDQTIKIWDLKNGGLLHTLTGHSASVTSVAISSNGRLIASGSTDKTIKIWR
jgi:WD40 repeat protein